MERVRRRGGEERARAMFAGMSHPLNVKRTSPDTENHDQNGYAKLYDDKNLIITNVDNDNTDTTYTNMLNM